MANDYDIKARNAMLDALGALAVKVALHTGDPGGADSATNEVTGGSYARGTAAWSAAASGIIALNGNVVINVPAGTTVTYASFWNAAGTVRYAKKIVTTEAFGAAGTYTLLGTTTTLDLNS
jgi:hypothetical protein